MLDGVELVIMATGTRHGHTQKRFRRDVHLLVVDVVEHLRLVLLRDRFGTQGQKAGGHNTAPVGTAIGRANQVAGNLLANELVIRQVVIEGFDDVVAIAPGVGIAMVLVVAGGVGIACDVEPMASPAFAIARRGEQAIYHAGKSSGRRVSLEGLDFGFRGRQSREVKRHTAQQCDFVRRGSGLHTFRFQSRQNELVHGTLHPSGVLHHGQRRQLDRLECPILAILFG